MIAGQPTAVIKIKVFPYGEPGKVVLVVESTGPADLSDREVATILRQAADNASGLM